MKRLIYLLPLILSVIFISPFSVQGQINLKKLKDKSAKVLQDNNANLNKSEKNSETKTDNPVEKETTISTDIIYVDINTGKNRNPGTADSPMKNIDKAMEKAAP